MPVISGPALALAATRPPLSATPGGVTSFQAVLPGGRANICQKLLWLATEPPMTAMAQVPAGVTREVARNGAPRGGACEAAPGPELAAAPQPAVNAAAARASAVRAGRAAGFMSAPAVGVRRRSVPRRTTTWWPGCPGRCRIPVPGAGGRFGR